MTTIRTLLVLLALASAPAFAQQATTGAPVPADWEHLSMVDRDLLVAPLRERWDANPAERRRMLEHARRWQAMTPAQRQHAHQGMRRWSHMSPEQREHARALFQQMRGMAPEQRRALREQWRAMTPEQRREWLRTHQAQPATP